MDSQQCDISIPTPLPFVKVVINENLTFEAARMEHVLKFLKENHGKDGLEGFLNKARIPIKKELDKRTPFPASAGGYVCGCTGTCDTSRCSCFKHGAKCTSKCHSGRGSKRNCKCKNQLADDGLTAV